MQGEVKDQGGASQPSLDPPTTWLHHLPSPHTHTSPPFSPQTQGLAAASRFPHPTHGLHPQSRGTVEPGPLCPVPPGSSHRELLSELVLGGPEVDGAQGLCSPCLPHTRATSLPFTWGRTAPPGPLPGPQHPALGTLGPAGPPAGICWSLAPFPRGSREATGEEIGEELRATRHKEAHLLHRRHEHARGGQVRDGGPAHPHPAAHGPWTLVQTAAGGGAAGGGASGRRLWGGGHNEERSGD